MCTVKKKKKKNLNLFITTAKSELAQSEAWASWCPGSVPKPALTSAWLCSSLLPRLRPDNHYDLKMSLLQSESLQLKSSSVKFYATLYCHHSSPFRWSQWARKCRKMLWTLIHRQHLTLFLFLFFSYKDKRAATLNLVSSSSFPSCHRVM